MKADVDFGQFVPDEPSYKNPNLIECNNVLAVSRGYNPIPSLSTTGIAVTGEVRGVQRFDLSDGTPFLIVGTDEDLFTIKDGIVTASGLGLALPFGDFWYFDQLGKSIYAVCATHGLYRLADILTDTTFAVNPGSPPLARALDTVGEFLFLGNLTDIDASVQPYRVRWSSYNNPTAAWDTDSGRQSGYVDMQAKFGEVTAIVGGNFDLIFQRNGVSRIWYTGGPTVFAKEVVEDERGCPAPQSIVRVGSAVYFLAHDGFCKTDGAGVAVISSDRVWDWFKDELTSGGLTYVQGAVDWANRSIVWAFPSQGRPSLTRQIIYNWGLERWTTASITLDWVVESTLIPANIDQTDPEIFDDDNLDAVGPTFDASSSRGRSLSAFVGPTMHEFTGPNLEASFVTGDYQPTVGSRSFIRSVWPIVRLPARTARASIGGRDTVGEDKTFGPVSAQGSLGFCPVISDAWYHSVKIEIPAGAFWSQASGFQIDWDGSGSA